MREASNLVRWERLEQHEALVSRAPGGLSRFPTGGEAPLLRQREACRAGMKRWPVKSSQPGPQSCRGVSISLGRARGLVCGLRRCGLRGERTSTMPSPMCPISRRTSCRSLVPSGFTAATLAARASPSAHRRCSPPARTTASSSRGTCRAARSSRGYKSRPTRAARPAGCCTRARSNRSASSTAAHP